MRSFSPFLLFICALCAAAPSHAEVEKITTICEQGICPHWWPKLNPPTGWTHDQRHSYLYNVNALAPEGESFANAATVMYANAVYKPRVPESKTLARFIEGDHESFKGKTPDMGISAGTPLRTRDGKAAETWLLEPKSAGQWERVAYFDEGEYYMVFVISSRTAAELKRHMPSFEALVSAYAE